MINKKDSFIEFVLFEENGRLEVAITDTGADGENKTICITFDTLLHNVHLIMRLLTEGATRKPVTITDGILIEEED